MKQRLRRRLAATLLAAAVPALVAGCGAAMQSDDLERRVESIHSVAAEGRLLADDVVGDRALSSFVRAHAQELASTAEGEAEKLADARAEGPLARRRDEAVELALEVSGALTRLQVRPDDRPAARQLAERLGGYAAEARELTAAQ